MIPRGSPCAGTFLPEVLKHSRLVKANPDLATVVCGGSSPEYYVVGLISPGFKDHSVDFQLTFGRVKEKKGLRLPEDGLGSPGTFPQPVVKCQSLQDHHSDFVRAGDMRVFEVEIKKKTGVTEPIKPIQSPSPSNWFLSIGPSVPLLETLLGWPTLTHDFDGIKIDWSYLHRSGSCELEHVAGWLNRFRIKVLTDYSSGLNLYPDFSILDSFCPGYDESISAVRDTLRAAGRFDVGGAILSLQKIPENHLNSEDAEAGFARGVSEIASEVAEHLGEKIDVVVVNNPAKQCGAQAEVLRFAAHVGGNVHAGWHIDHDFGGAVTDASQLNSNIKLLLAASPNHDFFDQAYDAQGALARSVPFNWPSLAKFNGPIVFDSICSDWDDVYENVLTVATDPKTAQYFTKRQTARTGREFHSS